MKHKLTDRLLAKSRGGPRRDVSDGGGLFVRLEPSGDHAFFVRFRLGGKNRSHRLGTYSRMSLAEARAAAEAALRRIDRGEDPGEPEAGGAPTFAELAQLYIAEYAVPRKRTAAQDRANLARYVLPSLGPKLAVEVRRRDVVELLDALLERSGGTTANRVQSLLSTVFRFGLERELVEGNPVAGIRRRSRERPRSTLLTDGQLAEAWRRWAAQSTVGSRVLRFALLTGLRLGEICRIHRGELDGEWLQLSAERTKSARARRVYLVPAARELLAGDGPYPFPGRPRVGRSTAPRPIASISRQLAEDRLALGYCAGPHTLRRTVATGLAQLGVAPHVVSEILGHAPQGVTRRHYDHHDYAAEARAALLAWEARLLALVDHDRPS